MYQKPLKTEQKIRPPRLPKKMSSKELQGGQVQSHERYTSLALAGTNLMSQVATHPAFEESSFNQVRLTGSEFEEIQLDDMRLVNCDLATAHWYKATWHRVELVGCHMTGFLAGEALLQDVVFKDCLIDLAHFRFSSFSAVRFEGCDLHEADFLETDMSAVSFVRCNLRQAELSGTRLAGVDLSTCNIDGAHLGVNELKGATLNITQAMALVESMGITIRSPQED
jgi:uncharacterized protein YjbI with pentapeptide repeats